MWELAFFVSGFVLLSWFIGRIEPALKREHAKLSLGQQALLGVIAFCTVTAIFIWQLCEYAKEVG